MAWYILANIGSGNGLSLDSTTPLPAPVLTYHCLFDNQEHISTRITRTPAFWWYPQPPHDYPYYWVIFDPKSKEDKVKVTNLKNSPKFKFFKFWNKHYTRHTLSSCYEMDLRSIVEDTERTRFCPQTDKVKPVFPPFNFVEVRGIMKVFIK